MPVKNKKLPEKPATLISPESMGGIYGGDGYTYQHRYIVCHIPHWLADKNFIRLMPEASGDIDVVFAEGRKHVYDHVQVKDHNIDNSEFAKVIKAFVRSYKATGSTYRNFILTCPSVSADIKALLGKLYRYKEFNDKLFGKANVTAMKPTKTALLQLLEKLKLADHFQFLIKRVSVEINSFDLHDDTTCKRQFVASMNEHPSYKKKIAEILTHAYSRLIREILAHNGKALAKRQINAFITESIAGRKSSLAGTVFHIHNWSFEKFEPKANIVLDWTVHFDRQTRKVPDQMVWNTNLLPALIRVKNDLVKKTSSRHIVLRGKCTLSTSIAFGNIFPEIGDWTIELVQPQQDQSWRSDATKIPDYTLKSAVLPGKKNNAGTSTELAVVFNITGRAIPDVKEYLAQNSVNAHKIVSIEPPGSPGNFSIKNDSEAVSLAGAAKDIIKQMIGKYKVSKTHLFYFGPAGLAVFLGHKLTSVGELQLYEFQDPGYKLSCLLKS